MTHDEQRAHVLQIARTYLGTPFHDGARIKGVGIDCANLLAEVFAEAGMIPAQEIAPYSPQWMLHRDEPLFEQYVQKLGHEVDVPLPGDIVLYKIGRSFSHGGIVASWPTAVIHAFKMYGMVVETGADEGDLRGRQRKFYSLW